MNGIRRLRYALRVHQGDGAGTRDILGREILRAVGAPSLAVQLQVAQGVTESGRIGLDVTM